jgi:hypothetical protein
MPLQLLELLQKGYFPIELPPPFSTNTFGLAITNSGSTGFTLSNTSPKFSQMTSHNLVRAGGLRRNLSIPNPKHFLRHANQIVANWGDLSLAANKSKYSLTKPITGRQERAISPEYGLNERTEKIANLRSTSKYSLITDISRFFPSIYTHSIPWALLGKKKAKNLHTTGSLKGTWQDELDYSLSALNNNQTIGIPIGPDSSRLIAEVLLGEIDTLLQEKHKKLKGIRFIDDYEFGLNSLAEAENVLSYLQSLLNEYELGLNPAKTKIITLPDLLEPIWTSKIRTFIFRRANSISQKNDIISYFNMVFKYLTNSPDEGILKYGIARLRSENIKRDNWELFENILCQCVLIDPACLPQVSEQLVYYTDIGFKVSKQKWNENLNKIIYEKVPLGHSSEAAWAMWLLKILNIPLSAKSAKIVNQTDDSIVSLMGLGLSTLGLANITYLSNLQTFCNPLYLYEQQWLLCL